MEIKKLKISEGFAYLRDEKISQAMGCFIESLEFAPSLSSVVTANIRKTQRYFSKQRFDNRVSCFNTVGVVVDQPVSSFAVEFEKLSAQKIILHDDLIDLNGKRYPLDDCTIGFTLALFAAQHPVTKLYDNLGNPLSLLLGLMYVLLWRTHVRVQIGTRESIDIADFLELEADASTLVQLALAFEPVNLLLAQQLSRTHAMTSTSAAAASVWPRNYSRLGRVHSELVNNTDELFLSNLFNLAVGRAIQSHEIKHFSEKLRAQQISRKEIANIVCTGIESKRYISDNVWKINKSKLIYNQPEVGEILAGDINLPFYADPKVSVLIPVYEKLEYTLACLKSIASHPPKVPFEVIVMDDRSLDGSARTLQQINNLRVVLNPQNLGFLRSCNNGAKHAKGEYLFFLNNDTQVKYGWLDELLDTFVNFPNCGLAGSKLIYPNGLLQEAGGIVWQDGSAWNYGNRQDPNLPQFNYAREVDYISGAAIMVPSKLFSALNGFDELYAPAYYEDTDLALRIRGLGKSVIYQPLSEVVHFEGISSGTDTSSGIKAYQIVNREKFLHRWKNTLQSHRPNGVEPHIERDRGAKGRVLFIDACTPTPDQDSGSIDIYNLMKVFVEMGWAVTFIPEDNYAYMDKYTPALQKLGIQTLYHPHIKSVDEHITLFGSSYDLVMAFRPMVTQKHISNLRQKCLNAKIVFNTVDLHFLRLEREAKLKNDPAIAKEGLKLKAIELDLMKQADLTAVVSSTELEMLQKMGVERVVHLPFSREIRPSNVPFEDRSGIIFVGGFQHNPNVDAVQYFVADIMPLVRQMLPGVKFHIVGSKTPKEIQDLACDDIVVHGFVEDLEALMETMRVNVAPLRYGAGTKGKVIFALANGLPTVSTMIGIEGMDLQDGIHASIADNQLEYSEKIARLHKDETSWSSIASMGLAYADKKYGVGALRVELSKIISTIISA